MSRRANPKIIGAFVIGAIALVVAGVLFFGSGNWFAKRYTYVMFFEGSVKGLNIGAPVDFRGVRIGSVVDIKATIDAGDLSIRIPVIVQIEPDRLEAIGANTPEVSAKVNNLKDTAKIIDILIKRGLRGQLELQSLVTGQLFINMDLFPDTPVVLVGKYPGYPEMPTIPSRMEELKATLSNVLTEFRKVPLEKMFNELSSSITGFNATVKQAQKLFTNLNARVLERGTDALADLQVLVYNLDYEVVPRLSASLDQFQTMIGEVNRTVVPEAAGTLKETRALVRTLDEQIKPLASDLRDTAKAARSALDKAADSVARAESVIDPDSPLHYELINTLQELSGAARSISLLADYLQRNPEALVFGKGKPGGSK